MRDAVLTAVIPSQASLFFGSADGTIEPEDFTHAKSRISERLEGVERALAARSSPDATLLAQLPEEYEALQAAWRSGT